MHLIHAPDCAVHGFQRLALKSQRDGLEQGCNIGLDPAGAARYRRRFSPADQAFARDQPNQKAAALFFGILRSGERSAKRYAITRPGESLHFHEVRSDSVGAHACRKPATASSKYAGRSRCTA